MFSVSFEVMSATKQADEAGIFYLVFLRKLAACKDLVSLFMLP